jgi:predicted RNA binding protein YcfA (HicA-like mRNA interferase family)
MQIDRADIEAALESKGFQRIDRSHKYFHHKIDGKETGIVTFTSHGSSYKTYGDNLLGKMKKQLKFNSVEELAKFVACKITGDGYNELLISRRLL